jgi:hypothetical protein
MARKTSHIGDFGSLRDAFVVLSEIYSLNGTAVPGKGGIALSGIPRARWSDILRRIKANEDMVKSLIAGSGQRASVQGRREVVLAVIAKPGDQVVFEVAALQVKGRGAIEKTLTVTSDMPDWRDRLVAFTHWDEISGVLPAAEGNNQRAMIGLVLQLAGIGRGKIEMVEAEVPEEVDEAAQSVRGADWLKAGLPRFENAAGEALWYLMRMRSVHARMIKTRKQGYYTSMALAAMYASGMSMSDISRATGMSEAFVDKLTPRPGKTEIQTDSLKGLGGAFSSLDFSEDERRGYCANRVWKGAAIYTRILDRRIRVGAAARLRIGEGEDIVTVARDLRIPRRDLIRVLSVSQGDAVAERERFVGAIIDPELVRQSASDQSEADS